MGRLGISGADRKQWVASVMIAVVLSGAALLSGCRAPSAVLSSAPPVAADSGLTPSVAVVGAPPARSPSPTVVSARAPENLASQASLSASGGTDSAGRAVDGDNETLWSAGGPPPQWLTLELDGFYRIDRIELVVAQTPEGQTTHEVWLGNSSGDMKLYQRFENVWTKDGQTLTILPSDPVVTNRVQIRTLESPSFVAWREVRILGRPPSAGEIDAAGTAQSKAARTDAVWPKIGLAGAFQQPVQITNAGDGSGRIFVSERAGRIQVIKDQALLDRPFLDLTDRVRCCDGEQGFFSVAFPPDFAAKRHFYVSYTTKRTDGAYSKIGDTVIARYRVSANPDVADPNSEEILLVIPQPAPIHNGGHLEFGPGDGYLYVGSGDGGIALDPDNGAQRLDTLLGKILRIDVESGVSPYAIPPSNPFARTAGARGEIWAIGLRNPWQFSFDRQSHDLYIADVGENQYEEINFQPALSKGGENYGWPLMEGDHCLSASGCDIVGHTMPVAEYDHSQGCAVIGGRVYRGPDPRMTGVFFYSDLCSGRIWGLRRTGDAWQSNLLYDERFSFTSIGEDEAGNLYLTDFGHGAILRLIPHP